MSKLEEVSHEMLVFLHPCVLSRVSGFPVASPCLWGKLQNLSFSKVSKQVVMPFCVAGVALCDIPTCLITCRKCQNWREVSHEMLAFSASMCFVSSLWFSCGVAVSMGEASHSTLYTPHSTLHNSTIYTLDSTLHTLHFTLHTLPLCTLHSSLLSCRLYTPHSTLYTPHSSLYTLHSTLYTLYSLHSTALHFTL